MKDKKILIISNLPIKDKNTGPSIRCINIAQILNKYFQCKLYAKDCSNNQKNKYNFLIDGSIWKIVKHIKQADIIFSQPSRFKYLFLSKLFKKKIIIDLYDPTDIENLEMYRDNTNLKSKLISIYSTLRLKYSILIGDYFVCANEIQRKYWIGYMQSLGKIKQKQYQEDSKLDKLIGFLPYGIEEEKNNDNKLNPILSISDKIKKEDKVIIWGGGIWNWFDTKNLIYAMNEIKKERNDIKLLFLGGIPDKKMKENIKYKNFFDTIKLAEKLEVMNENVFFNNEWVDYDKRYLYLANSYAGVSLHYDNLETTFSFRTRILDYLWMDLPFITTEGDYFSELNKKYNLGFTVDFENIVDIKNKIIEIIDNTELYKKQKENIKNIKKEFLWENVCKDLIKNIQNNNINNNYKKIGIISSIFYLIHSSISMCFAIFRKDF